MSIYVNNLNPNQAYFKLNNQSDHISERPEQSHVANLKSGDSVQLSYKVNADEIDTEKLLGEVQNAGHEQIADVHGGLTLGRVLQLIEGADG